LGLDGLELVDTEVPVGAYSADIVCNDTTTDTNETVLVENQCGRSDHDHFGKIMTYASGLKANTVVLICEKLRDEHRTAMTWLNSITEDSHNFFAVELELWRIDDSPVAPKFNVVVNPDNWARLAERTKKTDAQGQLSELKKMYLLYWSAFSDLVNQRNDSDKPSKLRPRKPLPQQWTGFSIGRSGIELNAALNSQARFLRAELTIHGQDARIIREALLQDRQEIHSALGYSLEWDELSGTQQAIRIHKRNVDPTDKDDWDNQHKWLLDRLNELHEVFHRRIKALK
jgi:hypothetical protein